MINVCICKKNERKEKIQEYKFRMKLVYGTFKIEIKVCLIIF